MPIGPIAQRIEAALKAGTELQDAVVEAFAYLDQQAASLPAQVGVSGDYVIVFLPGYGPLRDPKDFVLLSRRVT